MIADRKRVAIRNILRNETILQESGIYQRLEAALSKLPADVLSDLSVLIDQKVHDARRDELNLINGHR